MRKLGSLFALAVFALGIAGRARAQEPAAATSPGAELDRALAQVLRTGCAEGVPALAALAGQPGLADGERATAMRIVALCQKVQAERVASGALRLPAPDELDRSGRGKLVFVSTGYGIWTGIAIDILADIEDERAVVIPPLLGGAAGLTLSLLFTQEGELTNGQAWTIITGLDYGTYSGLLWGAAANVDESKVVVGTALVTGLIGGAAATWVASQYRPRQGDAELVRSGGLWGFATGALLAAIVQPEDSSTIFTMMGLGMDGGLLSGVLLAQVLQPSRNRVLLIDTAGLSGGLLGFAAAFLAMGAPDDDDGARIVAGSALGGLYLGLAAGVYLTRGMQPERQDALAPVPGLVTRDLAGRWGLGRLAVLPVISNEGGGNRLTGALAPVLGGVW